MLDRKTNIITSHLLLESLKKKKRNLKSEREQIGDCQRQVVSGEQNGEKGTKYINVVVIIHLKYTYFKPLYFMPKTNTTLYVNNQFLKVNTV